MKKLKLDFFSRLVLGALIVVLISTTLFLIERFYENQNSKQIISRTKVHLDNALERLIQSFYNENKSGNIVQYFEFTTIKEQDYLDSVLKTITKNELNYFVGVEGGFFNNKNRKFLGFAFPTSPPPQPYYGPPPREYEIIINQINESIKRKSHISQLYEFEPTVFLLATKDLTFDGQSIGAAYVLIRIEQLLPFSFYKKFFPLVLFLSFTGIGLAIYISWLLRKRVESIKNGLELIKLNQNLRLEKQKGILGVISEAINSFLDARDLEQKERMRLEKELQAKEKMASLGNLIAGVTHQIRTPLAIIKSKIQFWQKKIDDQNNSDKVISKESMSDVVAEIDKLAGLVNKLLLFLKNPIQDFQQIDINEIIDKAINLLQQNIKEKNIKINFVKSTLTKVIANSSSIEQVFINILVNAIQAVEDSGEISINVYQISSNQIAIDFRDNGVGINQEIQDKIFDPFFTTKREGYGLGLSIAYEIVKLHKGSIVVIPNEPKGTIFRVILPSN